MGAGDPAPQKQDYRSPNIVAETINQKPTSETIVTFDTNHEGIIVSHTFLSILIQFLRRMTLNLTFTVREFPRVIRKVLSKSTKWKEMQSMINKSSYKTKIFNRILHTMAHAGK